MCEVQLSCTLRLRWLSASAAFHWCGCESKNLHAGYIMKLFKIFACTLFNNVQLIVITVQQLAQFQY